jgi:hypothetical protein
VQGVVDCFPQLAVLQYWVELALQRFCSRLRPQVGQQLPGSFAASLIVAQDSIQNVVQPGTGFGFGFGAARQPELRPCVTNSLEPTLGRVAPFGNCAEGLPQVVSRALS